MTENTTPNPYPSSTPAKQYFSSAPQNLIPTIEGTITGPATTPQSYMIATQGRTCCCTRQHIHHMYNYTPTPFSRPSMHQDNDFTRPCLKLTNSQTDDHSQQPSTKLSEHSCIPTIQHTDTPGNQPETHCPVINHPLLTSYIPAPHCNPFSRPIYCSSNPFPRPINHSSIPFARPSASTPADINQFLVHLQP